MSRREKGATDQRTNREIMIMYRFFLLKKKRSYERSSDGFKSRQHSTTTKTQHSRCFHLLPANPWGRNAALPVFLDAILLRHWSVVLLTAPIDQRVFETGLWPPFTGLIWIQAWRGKRAPVMADLRTNPEPHSNWNINTGIFLYVNILGNTDDYSNVCVCHSINTHCSSKHEVYIF